jgi:hypothetical protein
MHQGYLKKPSQQNSNQSGERIPRQNYQGGQHQDQQMRQPRQQYDGHQQRENRGQPRNNYQSGSQQDQQRPHQPRMNQGAPMPHNMAMNMPMPMPVVTGMPMPMAGAGMPIPIAPKSGIHADYLTKTMPILNAIVEQNPNYK